MDALHIQLVLSLVKGENIPHFSYFNLVFFVIQDNDDSFFFGGSKNVTKFLKWKKNRNNAKGTHPNLSKQNKNKKWNWSDILWINEAKLIIIQTFNF